MALRKRKARPTGNRTNSLGVHDVFKENFKLASLNEVKWAFADEDQGEVYKRQRKSIPRSGFEKLWLSFALSRVTTATWKRVVWLRWISSALLQWGTNNRIGVARSKTLEEPCKLCRQGELNKGAFQNEVQGWDISIRIFWICIRIVVLIVLLFLGSGAFISSEVQCSHSLDRSAFLTRRISTLGFHNFSSGLRTRRAAIRDPSFSITVSASNSVTSSDHSDHRLPASTVSSVYQPTLTTSGSSSRHDRVTAITSGFKASLSSNFSKIEATATLISGTSALLTGADGFQWSASPSE